METSRFFEGRTKSAEHSSVKSVTIVKDNLHPWPGCVLEAMDYPQLCPNSYAYLLSSSVSVALKL